MQLIEEQSRRQPYVTPELRVYQEPPVWVYCQSSGDNPDPGGGEGFGDPTFL